jgi:hypothetical protein
VLWLVGRSIATPIVARHPRRPGASAQTPRKCVRVHERARNVADNHAFRGQALVRHCYCVSRDRQALRQLAPGREPLPRPKPTIDDRIEKLTVDSRGEIAPSSQVDVDVHEHCAGPISDWSGQLCQYWTL